MLYFLSFVNNVWVKGCTGNGAALRNLNVFVYYGVINQCILFNVGALHYNGVSHGSSFFYYHSAEEDGVFHITLYYATACYNTFAYVVALVIEGGSFVANLCFNKGIAFEQVFFDFGLHNTLLWAAWTLATQSWVTCQL